ncbi:hypothetical protein EZV62_022141 [Acer yangbiense]|uniref:Uncharacterized protein n=1 Tax=Acer yangbiense TaxID=1000413 RepID=A0A5C7H8W3_9ROSI|nr:hypothetical protein EZV62_022141 [Acer yangbiense]
MGGHEALEVAKTVLEVADVAWLAVECLDHRHEAHARHAHHDHESFDNQTRDDLEALKSENRRLRDLLNQNLKLLENLSESPAVLNDCPPDLYARLVATVDSEKFLTRLKSLHQASVNGTGNEFPFKEATGCCINLSISIMLIYLLLDTDLFLVPELADDVRSAGILINVDQEEPSWWVWVTEEMVPNNAEEWSGIDNENYVVVSEEHVVDGVAYFMAKCVMSNPKAVNLAPEELQKVLAKALGSVSKLEKMLDIWSAGKMFYTLSTWGLALAGLYKSRAVLRFAASGVHMTSKAVLRAL